MATPADSVALHPKPTSSTATTSTTTQLSPLPQLLKTPAGLALLELQGTINLPMPDGPDDSIPIGRIDFPDYKPDSIVFDPSSTAWMKRVYLYVGRHQRLTGEVKKLPKAMGIVRRRGTGGEGDGEDLEVVDIVKYKIVFSSRPEPVGTA